MRNHHGRVHVLLILVLILLPLLCASFLEAWNRRPSKEAARGTGAVRKNAATRSTTAGSGTSEQALAGAASAPSGALDSAPDAAKAQLKPKAPFEAPSREPVVEEPVPGREREQAVRNMGRNRGPDAGPELVALLRDPRQNHRIRHVAAIALAESGSPLAEKALLEASRNDPQWFSRWGITQGLGLLKTPAAEREMVSVLGRPWENDAVKSAAVMGLGGMVSARPVVEGQPRASTATMQALEEALKDPGYLTRARAAQAAAQIGDREAVPALMGILLSAAEQDTVRLEAVKALGTLGAQEAVEDLHAMAQDGSHPGLQYTALISLGKLAPAYAEAGISALQSSPALYDKCVSVEILAKVGTPWARSRLEGMLGDPTVIPAGQMQILFPDLAASHTDGDPEAMALAESLSLAGTDAGAAVPLKDVIANRLSKFRN